MTGARLDKRAELDALLVEYEALLSDERSYLTTLATLASVALALVAFIAAGAFGSETVPVCTSRVGGDTCTYFRVFSPLAPLVVILYVATIGVVAAIRSFQIRLVEERIRDLLPQGPEGQPPIASWFTTLLGFTSLRRGARTFRLLHFTILLMLATLFVGVVGFSIKQIESDGWRHFAYAFYASVCLLIGGITTAWITRGPSLWRSTYERARLRYDERMTSAVIERGRPTGRAFAYLLLPRPTDLVKGLCAIGSGVFVYFAVGPSSRLGPFGDAVTRLGVAVVLFEVLAYQARYQLNDIRGLRSDLEHPASDLRRRLTVVVDAVGAERAVKLALCFVFARLFLFVVLSFVLLPQRATWLTLGAAGAAYLIAVPYEWLREERRPIPGMSASLRHKLIYLYVGLGYANRAALGALLVAHHLSLIGLALVCLAVLSLGQMFVTMTWALEGTSALRGPARQADFDESLNLKSHIKPLTVSAVAGRFVPKQPTRWKILLDISDRRFALFWNVSLIASVVFGAVAAVALYPGGLAWRVAVVSVLAGIGAAWLLSSATTLLSMAVVTAAVAATGTGFAVTSAREGEQFGLSFGLLLTLLGTYVFFRSARYEDLLGFYRFVDLISRKVSRLPELARSLLAITLVGKTTLELLDEQSRKQARLSSRSGTSTLSSAFSTDQPADEPKPPAQTQAYSAADEDLQARSRIKVDGKSEAWDVIRSLQPSTLVLDVEPFVCSWDTDDESLREGLAEVLRACEAIPFLRMVVFLTNSPRKAHPASSHVSVRYIEHARKPYSRTALGDLERPVIVCGDQFMTDGLLAWLLGAVFVEVSAPSTAPAWVRVQIAIGRILSPFFFSGPRGRSLNT